MIFPARCPICKDVIPIEDRLLLYMEEEPSLDELYRAYVCPVCLREIDFIEPPYCKKCGRKLAKGNYGEDTIVRAKEKIPEPIGGAGSSAGTTPDLENANGPGYGGDGATTLDGLCTECRKRARAFVQCRACMSYDDLARELIANLKYKGHRDYVPLLSLLAADRLGEWIQSIEPDALVPVPVHKKRLRTRGYNQAELIADGIGDLLGIPVETNVLFRRKNTEAQKNLGADARLQNLRDAFGASLRCSGLSPKLLRRKPVLLLVDDIFTTGMTLNTCTEALINAGAARVYGLCIAAGADIAKNE